MPKTTKDLITAKIAGQPATTLRTIEVGPEFDSATDFDCEQLPVNPRLRDTADRDLGAMLGLPAQPDFGIRRCQNAFILSLAAGLQIGVNAVHYSRDRNTYVRCGSTTPNYWTYRNVKAAVNWITASPDHFGHNQIAPQNPAWPGFLPRRSSITAGPGFAEECLPICDMQSCLPPDRRIIIRDRWKRDTDRFPRREIAEATHAFLARYDTAVIDAALTIDHPSITWHSDQLGTARLGSTSRLVNLGRRRLVRIFNNSDIDGGRYYRAFWLEVPKVLRQSILIDGVPVEEYDYSACHLRLAYHAVGAPDALAAFGAGDLYALPDYSSASRRAIKLAVQILFNAKSLTSAQRAIAGELNGDDWDAKLAEADHLIDAIKATHPTLDSLWHRQSGLGLQFVDSEILRLVLTELMDRDILGLPVHDSILVPAPHLATLREIMDRTFEVEGARLAEKRFRPLRQHRFRDADLTNRSGAAAVGRRDGIDTAEHKAQNAAKSGLGLAVDASVLDVIPDIRRAQRIRNGKLPRVVDVQAVAPWKEEGVSRAQWYKKQRDGAARQAAAFGVLLARGDKERIGIVMEALRKAKSARMRSGSRGRVLADQLFDRLEEAAREAGWTDVGTPPTTNAAGSSK